MAASSFDTWWAFVERPDFDGQPLHRTEGDPGGATSWGWTYNTWVSYCRLFGVPTGSYTMAAFSKMTKDDFKNPTRIAFWNHVQGDSLPAGVDVIWADFQFGSGGATAALQRVLGVRADGVVGPLTIKAALEATLQGSLDTCEKLTVARKAYYTSLSGFSRFGRGWDRRADDCETMAQGLIAKGPSA